MSSRRSSTSRRDRPTGAWAALGLVLVLAVGAGVVDPNQAGLDAYARGDYRSAEHLFREAARRTPGEPVFQYHLAVTLVRLSRWREAAEAYQAVLRLDPPAEIAAAAREGLRGLPKAAPTSARRGGDAEPTVIPLTRTRGVWMADVVLNDRERARFLVDTGASVCVISPHLAETLRIRHDADSVPVQLETLGGRIAGHLVTIESVRVGDVQARDVPAVVHPTGQGMDGILGNTFLGRYNARLDTRRGALTLEPR